MLAGLSKPTRFTKPELLEIIFQLISYHKQFQAFISIYIQGCGYAMRSDNLPADSKTHFPSGLCYAQRHALAS